MITENFKPGTMDKLGLGYKKICERKPDIVYAALSGYGQTGPYRSKAAYDTVIQAAGSPLNFSKSGPKTNRPAPLRGQHNEEVLCGMLGYTKEDLEEMRKLNVIL